MFIPSQLAQIEAGVKIAASVQWHALWQAFRNHDYADGAEMSVEDALLIVQPWLPQAGVARGVLHVAWAMSNSIKSDKQATGKITPQDVIKGLYAASNVDWVGFGKALAGDNAIVAGADTAKVLATLAAPFFPPAAVAADVFGGLAYIGAYAHPANPEHIDGSHWDSLRGFVKDKPGQKPEEKTANNPLVIIAKWLGL